MARQGQAATTELQVCCRVYGCAPMYEGQSMLSPFAFSALVTPSASVTCQKSKEAAAMKT